MWVTEYTIIGPKDLESLTPTTNVLIKSGWQPLGGPCCASEGQFIQAMVKLSKRQFLGRKTTDPDETLRISLPDLSKGPNRF